MVKIEMDKTSVNTDLISIFMHKGYIFLIYFFCIISIVFYYFSKPENIPDYYAYLQIIDSIYYFYDASQIYYEPASTLLLYTSRLITGETIAAVTASRYFITLIFVIFLYYLGKYRNANTFSLVLILSVFGPLIGFVTIRATPAYILVTLAGLDAMEGRRRALIWCILAIQFHVSAMLAVPAVIFTLIQNRTNYISFIEKSLNGVIIFFALIGSVFIYFGRGISNVLLQAVSQVGFLGKYISYVGVLDQNSASNASIGGGASSVHQIYLIAVSLFFIFFIFQKNMHCVKFRSYTIVSFAIFLFMQFSPVTAFRFSIYWIVPALLFIPWNSHLKWPIIRLGAIMLCLGVFIFQLNQIVI